MKLNSQQREVVKRCQTSAIWFMRNFVRIKHPGAGIIEFEPHWYQRDSVKAFRTHRKTIFRKTRQAGISKIAGLFAMWFGMFAANKTILIVSRTDEDAKNFLFENVKLPFRNLPQWMQEAWLPRGTKDNEHALDFSNGTKIRSLTSHPDVLRSNASSLNIIDECAFIQDMDSMWAGGASTLMHGGCISADSLISAPDGLNEIGCYHPGGTAKVAIARTVFTDVGTALSTRAYDNGHTAVVQLVTRDGHCIEATSDHKFRVLSETGCVWRKASDLKVSDYLVLSDRPVDAGVEQRLECSIFDNFDSGCRCCGTAYDTGIVYRVAKADTGYCASCLTTMRMVSTANLPTVLSPELAEFIGIYVGDGYYQLNNGRFGVSCDRSYRDYIEYLKTTISHLFNVTARDVVRDDDWQVQFCSRAVALLFRKNGIVKPSAAEATIPAVILRSPQTVKCAFLRGLFETDGCVSGTSVSLASASVRLVRQVQTVLLTLGMRSRVRKNIRTSGYSAEPIYHLNLKTRRDVLRFKALIGFISSTKVGKLAAIPASVREHGDRYCVCLNDFYRASTGLGRVKRGILHRIKTGALSRRYVRLLAEQYKQLADTTIGSLALNDLFTDELVSIGRSTAHTYDLTVEPAHHYVANGFITHNSLICISTTRGVGNWYWNTYTDAEAGLNDFHPIFVRWWDMTWRIEYVDQLSGQHVVVAPTEGITETIKGKVVQHEELGRVELDPAKYGPYWSPWLEREWRSLQAKGEGWKFDQEILAEFIGSGATILPKNVLVHIGTTISDQYQRVSGPQVYIHPTTGVQEDLDFTPSGPEEGLWVWKTPVLATPDRYTGQRIIEAGRPAHTYVMGVDVSTGKGRDYSTIEVLDIDEREQVAELMFHCLPSIFVKMVDRIGRWYNCALAVIERNNGGDDMIDDLQRDFMYPRLWRRTAVNDRPSSKPKHGPSVTYAHYGHFTSQASKPVLNKYILDYIRDIADVGFRIYSRRLLKQFQIYVRKKDRAGRDTGKTEAETGPGNFDDLVMACALALIGVPDSIIPGGTAALPVAGNQVPWIPDNQKRVKQLEGKFAEQAGQCLMPMTLGAPDQPDMAVLAELMRFAGELTIHPKEPDQLPAVKQRRHQF